MELQRRISEGRGEFLLFALTPPRQTASAEAARQIAEVTAERLRPLGLDGLILYDIDDESDRNRDERPFPFLPTMDPADYLARYFDAGSTPVVVYRTVGKYAEPDLEAWLRAQDADRRLSVFVGAASRATPVATTLRRAHTLRAHTRPDLLLGGVAIPERHARDGDEHRRLLQKQDAGCSFFVTQVIYDVTAAKNLVSDYCYESRARGVRPAPMVFTFSVCGTTRTLEFLRWLGVDVPRWLENELLHADDTLEASFEYAVAAARELVAYCRRLGVPFGLNVESVSSRRAEIEASVDLAATLRGELRR